MNDEEFLERRKAGQRLKAIREAKGLTTRKVAEVSKGQLLPTWISNIETGITTHASWYKVRLYAYILGISPVELDDVLGFSPEFALEEDKKQTQKA